ncbi:MAG: glycosyl hydrolase, partial [Planctomycetota bacterium]
MTARKAIPAPTTLALAAASVLALATAAPHAAADTKRGIAGGDIGVANALNARWYYRWSGTPPTGFDAFNGQYVPMIWSANPSNIDSKIDTILNLADDYNVQHVLGFNEPERVNQANMTVAQAIDVWEVIDERFEGTGIELVSPANSGGVGEAWLADFMAEAELRDLRVDAIGWHWYGNIGPGTVNSAANNFISKIDQLYALYNRPIWITEFGGLDFANTISSPDLIQANEDFLDIVIPQLEARSHVVAYAWWQYGQPDNGEERDTLLVEQVDGVWTPTGIGDEYIPTLHTGDNVDINGVDQGADTFYFRGGALTNNGAALTKGAGSVVALESSTSIGGSSDFGIAGGGVFVVPGATLNKDGTNTIRILGRGVDNDGDLHLNQGTLQVEAGNITGTGTTHLNAGGTLSLGNASDRAGVTVGQAIAFNGGTVQTNAIIDGTHQLNAGGQLNADTVFTGDGNLIVAGPLTSSGSFGLVKDGTGRLTLTASNSYTGDTTLRAGTVALTGSGDLGASPNIRIDAGATLDVSALASGYTLNNQQLTLDGDIAGDLNATAGSTVNVNSVNSLNGSLALDASLATGGGRVTGSLSSANGSTVQVGGDGIGALSAGTGIVTTGLTLNFDAALDTPGDAAWDDAATGQSLAFASGVSPIGVNDPSLPGLTAAYNIPTTGIADGLNGYFETGGPVRSTSDATFE